VRSLLAHWKADVLASTVVFLVALPLCMGIAIASGVPPALGLITGIIGGLVVGFIAGSPLQVSGPAAGLAVLVYEIVQNHGIGMLGVIVLAAGVIQAIAGMLKLGQWFRAISPAVVFGMLAGIGVLIMGSQFHVMLDDKPGAGGLENLLSIPQAIYKNLISSGDGMHHLAAGIGLLTIIIMAFWSKFRPSRLHIIPAPLVAILFVSGVAMAFRLPISYVDVPSRLLDAASFPTLDIFSRLLEGPIIAAVAGMAFIASAETLLSASAVDRLHLGVRTNYDRELTAQGIGNIICGLLAALPMTGVIVRSSANVEAGAKSRLSTILHGLFLLIAVLLLPHVLRLIPTSALAAILVYTGYKLVDREKIRELRTYGKAPLAIYFVTLISIVATDLLIGVMVGLALSAVNMIYRLTHLHVELRESPDGSRADLYLEGSATFLRLPKIATVLDRLPSGIHLHVHPEKLLHIDHACLDLLAGWRKQNEPRGSLLVVQWDGLVARYEKISRPDELAA
jgi:MFS superfamily sulfate permease-like transporter